MWIEWQVCGYRYGAGNKWKTNHLFQWILSRSNDVEDSLVCQYFFSMQKTKNKTIDIQPHLFENETEVFVKLIKKNDYRRIVVRQMSFSKLLKKLNEQASFQMNWRWIIHEVFKWIEWIEIILSLQKQT